MAGPSLIATLGANIAPFLSNLDQAKTQAKEKGDGIASALGDGLAEKLGELAAGIGIEETIRRTVEYGEHVQDLSNRLGISTDAVQQWDYALRLNGSSIDAAAGFFEKLGIAREKALSGNDKAIAAFDRLGVSLNDLQSKRIEDVASTIAKAFELGDPQALIASLREVGGKGAGQMAAAFRSGLAEELKEAPLISSEEIANLKEAADAWTRIKAEFTAAVAPLVSGVTQGALAAIDFARDALAIAIGALMGLIETIKGVSWKDLVNPAALIARGAENIARGSGETLDAVILQQQARDAAAAAKRGRVQNPITGEFDGTDAEGGKAQKAAEKAAAAIAAAETKEANRLTAAYNKDLNELHRQEAELKKYSEMREADYEVNSLQKTGGFLGSITDTNQIAMIEVQKKSEEHLADIRKEIKRITGKLAGNYADDTQF